MEYLLIYKKAFDTVNHNAIFMKLEHYGIDLLAILEKSLDRAIFLCNFIREVR